MAIEFVHRYQELYPYVFWFPAEESSLIEIAYQKLAQDLQLDTGNKPIDAIVRTIKAWFDRHNGCLLVYDNAPNYKSIQDYLPLTGSHILVTSRNYPVAWVGKSITVDVFTVEEARQYIQQLLGDQLERLDGNISWKDVDSLAELLGYLPLALAQAGAYIKETTTISRYLELYKQHTEKLLADASMPNSDHESVFVTWDITMEAIKEKSPLAAHLLQICAYIASEDIPIFFLQALTDRQENNPNSEILEGALRISASYSMIKIDTKMAAVSLHRLLQKVIQLKPKTEAHPLTQVHDLLLQVFPDGNSLEDYKKKARLIPHMEAVLGHLDKAVLEHSTQYDQYTLTRLLYTLAEGYRVIGDSRKGRDVLERRLSILEEDHDPDNPGTAVTLTNLNDENRSMQNEG